MATEIANFRTWLNQNRHRRETYAIYADAPGEWTTAEEFHQELQRHGLHPDECTYLASARDAWLRMTNQWEYNCADCATDCTDERYMVKDEVWANADMCGFGFLCVGCIEQRLNRPLAAHDFINVPLNSSPLYRRSERLTSRLSVN
ncbi:hypothetical protein AB0N60_13620 [Streptomyces microflavus]|uniref:hypothetical protein n=1 Tax=Streptomyces microflavus TaxID=1919 RepID=UPI00344173DB